MKKHNEEIKKAQDALLDGINIICKRFGLNNIMAQLYALLYFNGKPMSLGDMAEHLGISKPSASIHIRSLERYRVVRRVWVKGSRKDYYEAESAIEKVIIDRIRSMAQGRLRELDIMLTSSSAALEPLKGSDDGQAVIFRERLKKLRDLYTKAEAIFSFLDTSASAMLSGAPASRCSESEAKGAI